MDRASVCQCRYCYSVKEKKILKCVSFWGAPSSLGVKGGETNVLC